MSSKFRLLLYVVILFSCAPVVHTQPEAEKDIKTSREKGLIMSRTLLGHIKNDYYDPKFHGLDLDARFKLAEQKIKEALTAGQIFGILAQAIIDLNDSHTALIPPLRDSVTVYGWRMKMFGNTCFITAVQPGSDAEAKGLKPGDQVLAINGNQPTRENFWKIRYYYYSLRPKSRVVLVTQRSDGSRHEAEIVTRTEKKKYLALAYGLYRKDHLGPELGAEAARDLAYEEFGTDLIICRFPRFDLEDGDIDKMMKRINGHKALVFDLRDNPGGYPENIVRIVSYLFDHEVKIANRKTRRESKEMWAKPRSSNRFAGDLIVLINSQSTSASEIFARVIQLEKRGTIIGDHSGGMVMESVRYPLVAETFGRDTLVYGLSLTVADIVPADGQTLEWTGVTPDKLMLPSADDIRLQRDPVLAYAASLAGVSLDAEKAGVLFPVKPLKEN